MAACSTPTAASGPHKNAELEEKKPGTPVSRVVSWFVAFPNIGPDGQVGRLSIRDQNSRSRSSRQATLFPAIIDPLMAPIEVPMTQSGSRLASHPLIGGLGTAALHDKHDPARNGRMPCRFGVR